jgi:hypothetical protein
MGSAMQMQARRGLQWTHEASVGSRLRDHREARSISPRAAKLDQNEPIVLRTPFDVITPSPFSAGASAMPCV